MRACQPKRPEEKRGPQPFGSSFYMFFSPPPGPPSQECGLFYLRSSLQSSDLPLFDFCGLFLSVSFSHHPSGLLFPILPNSLTDFVHFQVFSNQYPFPQPPSVTLFHMFVIWLDSLVSCDSSTCLQCCRTFTYVFMYLKAHSMLCIFKYLFYFLDTLCVIWDFNSQTRDQTCTPCI